MGWQDHLNDSGPLTAPWLGGRKIHRGARTWRVLGRFPREHGWYGWKTEGRNALMLRRADPDPSYWENRTPSSGYLVGNRFIPRTARVEPDPNKLIDQTVEVYLVEPGLDRFTPVQIGFDGEHRPIYMMELFPEQADIAVREAYIDRKESIDDIPGVVPALDLAFRFATHQRRILEARRAELQRQAEERRRREEAERSMGTGLGRRRMAAIDFSMAASAALSVSGAELLDARDGRTRGEVVVRYRMENRRFECVVERETLRVVDSGVCLTDEWTGEKGDTYFTLESLPSVISQAIRENRLVVYRRVD